MNFIRALRPDTISVPMIKRALCVFFVLSGCSSNNDVKVDWTVTYTDEKGHDNGIVESGSFDTLSSTTNKTLKFSTATLDVKSDASGLHFAINEDMVRRGA